MANLFQRITSSWTKPTKRNSYWPLSAAVGSRVGGAITARRTDRKAKKHHRAVTRWERKGRHGPFPKYPGRR